MHGENQLNDPAQDELFIKRRRTVGLFGLAVGLVVGGVVAWRTAAFFGRTDLTAPAILVGELVGGPAGFALGRQGVRRGSRSSPSIATTVCCVYTLLPACLILLSCGLGIRGGRIMVGLAFAWPMGGLLVGGVLDRFFEWAFWGRNDSDI